jgi:hypothetical protein
MGAALTYARRYALFTIVGIAGEDDLDAPDLALQTVAPNPQSTPPATKLRSNGQMPSATAKAFHGPRKEADGARAGVLPGEASATLRDQLVAEMAGLGSEEDLDTWTLQAWPRTNTLMPADGDKVRQAFQARLARLQTKPDDDLSPTEPDQPAAAQEVRSRIDKSVLAIPVARRLRDKTHVRGQTTLPRLRAPALRPAPFALCPAARSRSQGQR